MNEKELKMLGNFDEWTRVTKNMYRYVTNISVYYEIVITKYVHNTDMSKVLACLFLTRDWINHSTEEIYFSRELLCFGTVEDCIKKAVNNYITSED